MICYIFFAQQTQKIDADMFSGKMFKYLFIFFFQTIFASEIFGSLRAIVFGKNYRNLSHVVSMSKSFSANLTKLK